jgi:serine/threonine protein kinase
MDTDRWRQVESIFYKALEADDGHRARVLDDFCAGDEALRREVESLLAQHETAGDFIETPAFVASTSPSPTPPRSGGSNPDSSLPGTVIGHFHILGRIGSGGMGVVYEAEDLKLGRQVALKFLPEELTNDPQALQRFHREARAASALNHSNICTIYEVDQVEGRTFIAMELLEGETLREVISAVCASVATPLLPLAKLLDLAVQVADGLVAAHHKGIVHRDIKPANIFLTTGGG